jgi:hypothetical protein
MDKPIGLEIEIEKESPMPKEGMPPEKDGGKETPEQALEKALRSTDVADAMDVLRQCGYELKAIEGAEDEMDMPDEGGDVLDRFRNMEKRAVSKAFPGGKK